MDLTTKHDLPSGGWVELRNANYLRAKDRTAFMRSVTPVDGMENVSKIDLGFLAINEVGALMIVAWSLPYEPEPTPGPDGDQPRSWTLPKNDPSILEELMAPDAVELEKLLGPARQVLMPQAPSPDQSDDPESPSGPGNA